jgi:hypothetical protein
MLIHNEWRKLFPFWCITNIWIPWLALQHTTICTYLLAWSTIIRFRYGVLWILEICMQRSTTWYLSYYHGNLLNNLYETINLLTAMILCSFFSVHTYVTIRHRMFTAVQLIEKFHHICSPGALVFIKFDSYLISCAFLLVFWISVTSVMLLVIACRMSTCKVVVDATNTARDLHVFVVPMR